MSRLVKQASSSIQDIVHAIMNDPSCDKEVKQIVEKWSEDNLDDDLNVANLVEEFKSEMLSNPDDLFEKLIDLVPNDGDDDKLYNASMEDKQDVVEEILDKCEDVISYVIEQAVDDEQLIRDENIDDENGKFGPGMYQRDFL